MTAVITESLRTAICISMLFPSENAEKAKSCGVKFRHLGRGCQMLCGFAAFHMFFVQIVREVEDVQRSGSCQERGLELGMLLGLSNV